MRVHRHGQGGMVGRVPLWAARWLGLALIVVTATPSVTRATLKCIGDPVFVSDCQAAIEGIRKTTQIGSDIIETIENPQGKDHIIERASGVNKNIAINGAGAHDPLVGSDTLTLWNPDNFSLYADGVPRNPEAALMHELYHGMLADQGTRSSTLVPGTRIKTDEVDVTAVENEHRSAKGEEQRQKYGNVDVPQIEPPPSQPPPQPPPSCDPTITCCDGQGICAPPAKECHPTHAEADE